MEDVDRRFIELLGRLKSLDWHDGASRADFMITDAQELIEHGEQGVALENICQNLYEFSVPISQHDLTEISLFAETMQMPESTWKFLQEIVA